MVRKYIWSVLIVGFVLFSLLSTFYELKRSGDLQPDRQFELIHNFPTDYNFYLSRIREGLEGRWTSIERYTSEPHEGSIIHELYILMGRIGRWVRVPWHRAGDIYHVARIVLAVTLLAMIAEFCRRVFVWKDSENIFFGDVSQLKSESYRISRAQLNEDSAVKKKYAFVQILSRIFSAPQNNFLHPSIVSFLLVVTASSWPKLVYVDGVARFGGYMPWWSVMDSLQRITFIPHLLAGQALIVFLIMTLLTNKVLRSESSIFLGILAFVLGLVFPPGLLFVYVLMGVYALLQGKEMVKYITPFFMIFLISMPSLVYLGLMTQIYPWKRLAEVDVIRPLPFDYWEYIKAVGPIGPIGLLGLIWALFRREKAMFSVVSWVISWLGLLFVFHFIPAQSPLRFSEMIPHIALGILSAYLFFEVGRLRVLGYLRHVIKILPILLISIGLFHMYSSFLWQKDFIDHKIRATTPLVPTGSYVMYPLKDFIAAIVFLQDSTSRDAVILSESTAGNYIPVYSGNRVYIGHDNTVHFEIKKEEVKQFFSGSMSVTQAKSWLNEKRISRVFFGPQEKEEGRGKALETMYPFLVNLFSNAYVTVYAVEGK